MVEGGATAYLAYIAIDVRHTRSEIQLRTNRSSDAARGDGINPGPQLTNAWEQASAALTISAGDLSITFVGPNSASAARRDSGEPYSWRPAQTHNQLEAWVDAYLALSQADRNATTITLAPG